MTTEAGAAAPRDDHTPPGHGPGLVRIAGMWRIWQLFRIVVSLSIITFGIAFGVAWDWPGGLFCAVVAVVALIDAVWRHQSEVGSPLPSLLLDITLIGVSGVIIGLDAVAVSATLLYMMSVPLVLLPWKRALPVAAYGAAWAVVALATVDLSGPPTGPRSYIVNAIVALMFGALTLALLALLSSQLERSYRHRERRLRYEEALARCGEALLANPEERAIDAALQSLLLASPAQNVFVDENYDDPVLGLSLRVTHEAIRPGYEDIVSEEIWADEEDSNRLVRTELAYSDLPDLHAALSQGQTAVVHTRDLQSRAREIYEEDGCKSELNIPITVDGEWVGSLGFADYLVDRQWARDDLGVLQTAAAMIGSFWERGRAMQNLEELVKSKDQFLASISHEIRTPLTAVLGFSEVLREEAVGLGPGGIEMVGLVVQQAREIADIVEDLLVAARADMDALVVVNVPVSLAEEAQAVVAARATRTPLEIAVGDADVFALGDPVRIRQITRCLVSNAMRYGGECVQVRIRRDGNRATLALADNGPGVPPGHERHIFDAFHRARTDDGKTQAIGLGLYVSHHLAKMMDGDLTYRRESGWTIFELDLPVSAAVSDELPALPVSTATDATEVGDVLVPHP